AFQNTFGRSPRELRKGRRGHVEAAEGDEVALRLAFRPPYDWAQVRDFLATRAVPGIERVDDGGYARTVACGEGAAIVRVRPLDKQHALELRVQGAPASALFHLSAAARRVFDVGADPARIVSAFAGDPLLAPMARRQPGLRIPGVWDGFECAV